MNPEKRLYLAVCYFLIISSFVYVFAGLAGVNLPRYYPELGVWSITKLTGPSMGYYAKVGFTFLLVLPLTLIFYLLLPFISRRLHLDSSFVRGLTVASLLWGMFFFIIEEWHKWAADLFDETLTFFFFLILFLILLKFVFKLERAPSSNPGTTPSAGDQ